MKAKKRFLLGGTIVVLTALAAFIVLPSIGAQGWGQTGSKVALVAEAAAETQVAQAQPAASAPASSLPGGANSVEEIHQDWKVACSQQGEVKRCGMTQQQHNAQTRQRVLAVEFHPAADGLTGALVLPFGLSLDGGITLQIDDASPQPTLRFSTCIPGGCVVPLTFDAAAAQALAQGTALKVNAVADGGQELAMSVSLKGFSVARKRIVELSQ